jgi:hypothetical protein
MIKNLRARASRKTQSWTRCDFARYITNGEDILGVLVDGPPYGGLVVAAPYGGHDGMA